jgi:acyl-CoA synthetase (AMP-forming)/AMP-acid ligase II
MYRMLTLAYVVLKPGMAATAEALITYRGANLAHCKVTHRVEFLDALPILGAGKILKRALYTKYT